MSWRALNTGYADGATNMAVDEAIMRLHGQVHSPPTLRFYGWCPPCLSIGYAQSAEREVNLERCRERGIDLVRRSTGGRAVLHHQELTYSLVALETNPLVAGGIVESYRKISQGLVQGLRRLGVDVQATERLSPATSTRSAACFDSPSHYEVTVGGRKLVGSAQMRSRGVILQHGSLLLEVDVPLLFELLRSPPSRRREPETAAHFAQGVVGLRELLGRPIELEEVAQAVRAGFAEAFGVQFEVGELSAAEKALAQQLRAEKYGQPAWNLRR